MRPHDGADNQTMFDEIVVYIVNMPVEVILTSDNMIPESVLPNTPGSDVQPVAESGGKEKFQSAHNLKGAVSTARWNRSR